MNEIVSIIKKIKGFGKRKGLPGPATKGNLEKVLSCDVRTESSADTEPTKAAGSAWCPPSKESTMVSGSYWYQTLFF